MNAELKHPLDDANAMREKVAEDIAFLNSKIDLMMKQPRPNQMLIEHYTGMLKSRQAVFSWLKDGEISDISAKLHNAFPIK